MINKSRIKYIKSLQQKKYRKIYNEFIIEGDKITKELLTSEFKIKTLVATQEWLNDNLVTEYDFEIILTNSEEIKKVSCMKTPQHSLAIVEIPEYSFDNNEIINNITLVLDNIQDPGNLGTIIRTADWFGIKNVFCSLDTVELYNPKVVQSTMGSLFRTRVHYIDLLKILEVFSQMDLITVYGAYIDGDNFYEEELDYKGIVVLGNEANGISPDLGKYINKRIAIPSYNQDNNKPESLNVAVAAAVICSEFRRRHN